MARPARPSSAGPTAYNHYWGNFDQDNTTTGNDANVFIGSSFIGDGAGRQLWNFRDGTLRGDRPHLLKLYGYYMVPWHASFGAYFVAQSGQPWENVELRAVHRVDDQHERRVPLRRRGRIAPNAHRTTSSI